jgi:bifunctional DNase/RNase
MDGSPEQSMVEMRLARIIRHDASDRNFIFLVEDSGERSFPIVIGRHEAEEIHRILVHDEPARPLTHQLTYAVIEALGAEIRRCDIVDLRNATFFAQLVLQTPDGDRTAVVDSRPSDAIALALRGGSPIRVAESILEQVRSDDSGPDVLPP